MQNNPVIPDEKMHVGHRGRMRDKLMTHGARIFDTYELLEMLLYYTIPYKDTNPIAKRLLSEFGSLDGVLSAPKERLAKIVGVGERTAELINAINDAYGALFLSFEEETTVYDDYDLIGRRFAEYFNGCKTYAIAMMMLDNSMRERAMVTIFEDTKYSSAAVTARPFVSEALLADASIVVIARNHPYGPCCSFAEDHVTSQMIDNAMEHLGIFMIEDYVVSGNQYLGTKSGHRLSVYAGGPLEKFFNSRDCAQGR